MKSIFLDLGFIQIYWYSVTMFIGILLGAYLVLKETRKFKITDDFMVNMIFYLIPIAIIGARLYYVVFNWDYYSNNFLEAFEVWNGGLAIHGAIITGIIWVFIYTKKYKVSTVKMLDMMVPGLILGQVIGRWGNFFNGEAFGPSTTLTFLQNLHLPKFIIDGMFINGTYHHPTFLYESLWCLVGLVIILLVRRWKYIKKSQVLATYLIWYSIGRFFIEGLRTDSLMLGSLKAAQLVSLGMIVIGIVIILLTTIKKSKFDNLYNEEVNNEVKF